MKAYRYYTSEDFASDPDFIRWVRHPNEKDNAYWKDWLKAYPEQAEEVAQARLLLSELKFSTYTLEESRKAQILQQIYRKKTSSKPHKTTFTTVLKYAASIALLTISILMAWYINSQQLEEVATAFQETMEITLPDGSVVVLNANTTLRWTDNWDEKMKREVWLKGEAFFDIRKLKSSPLAASANVPFIVHLDDVDVNVLGTSFNVYHRHENTKVILNTGKVQVRVKGKAEEVSMVPGDMVEIGGKLNQVVQKRVLPDEHSSWKENKLVFNHHSLEEIAQRLEDLYGFEVEIKSEELKKEKFSGSTPADDLEVLFLSLQATLKVDINQEKNKIIIQKKNLPGT